MTEPAEQVEYSWITGIEPLRRQYDEWDALCSETGADIYLTPGWFDVWWQNFGKNRALLCLTARAKTGKLVGLLPFMIDKIRLGPFVVKVARLAATDPHAVVFSVPVVDGCLEPMLKQAAEDILITDSAANLISFTPASEKSSVLQSIQSNYGNDSKNSRFVFYDKVQGSHTVFELPTEFEEYLSLLSKKRRSQFRRDLRRLEGEFDLQTKLVHPHKREFDDFITFHNTQWQEVGHGGHFSDWRGSARFYADLSNRLHGKGSVWLEHMIGSNGPMATQFCLVSGKSCHWRLPARSTDPEYARLSLGTLGLILMIKRAIEAGVDRIEAGVGSYDYKQVYGAIEVPVHRLIIAPKGLGHQMYLYCLLAWARMIHVGYYRLWFGHGSIALGKILPLKRRSIWQSWVRSRV